MMKAIDARQYGDEYQQLVFWKYALMMLNGTSEIESIGFECNKIKTFDDIVISYSKPQKFRSSEITKEYIQVKFHMKDNDVFTLENLLDPSFINASRNSFLDNVVATYKKLGTEFTNSVFIIYTVWDIKQGDVLNNLVNNTDSTIDLKELFKGKTKNSKMGKIRENLQKKLGVDENELKCIMGQIKIFSRKEKIDKLVEKLNHQLEKQGLNLIRNSTYLNPYSQLIQKLSQAGDNCFDKESLTRILKKENLYISKKDKTELVIRSYNRDKDHQYAEDKNILKLENYFDGRFLKLEYQWEKTIYPLIKNFITKKCLEDKEYHILLDANPTIAFMTGRILDMKTAIKIVPKQREENGLKVWEKKEGKENYPKAIYSEDIINNTVNDVAIVISFSRDIISDVKEYLIEEKKEVGRILHFRLESTDSSSVIDGTHAYQLTNQIKNIIDQRKLSEKRSILHIFMACPNAIVFLLARYSLSFGKVQLYEHDFKGEKNSSYYPTMMLSAKKMELL
ncbi:hypothetical protein FUSO7_11305 [Fusobacterium necrophorum BFTR-2]|nr:SAVED domain-containing protein [Fusobacterium necrophorum]KDE69731.1 hypothetical protein FUSO7_11305 [Fusobacterium necrophorum BFTR-2]